jgi:hypothetical protein
VEALKTLLEKYKAEGRSTPGPAQRNNGEERRTASVLDESGAEAFNPYDQGMRTIVNGDF